MKGAPVVMNQRVEDKEDAELAEALKTALGRYLSAVIFFGSRARKNAAPHSDWDVLVVADGLPQQPYGSRLILNESLPAMWRGRVSLITHTPDEFTHHVSSLLLNIAVDGMILEDH